MSAPVVTSWISFRSRSGQVAARARPYLLETSAPGVFAADVRHGSIKRVASAVGEGSMAIAFIHQYLAEPTGAAVSGQPSMRDRARC
jgi:thioredoxin reductase (NADPH)